MKQEVCLLNLVNLNAAAPVSKSPSCGRDELLKVCQDSKLCEPIFMTQALKTNNWSSSRSVISHQREEKRTEEGREKLEE